MEKRYLSALLLISSHSLSAMDLSIATSNERQEKFSAAFDIEQTSILGRTPLIEAVMQGNSKQVQSLLQLKANTEAQDPWRANATPLQSLILLMDGTETEKALECVNLLINYGASLECDSKDHSRLVARPLFLAAKLGLVCTVKKLLEAGADYTQTETIHGQELTASDVAQSQRDRDSEKFDLILQLIAEAEYTANSTIQAAL